jgi:hypothetical protein
MVSGVSVQSCSEVIDPGLSAIAARPGQNDRVTDQRTGSLLDWADRLAAAADYAVAHRTNEEELRLDLNAVIVNAARSLYGSTESFTSSERSSQADHRSPYDNLYGGVVVEWEWAMGRARRRHGAEQALGYLANLRARAGNESAFTAVVSDGRQWGFLAIDPERPLTLFDTDPEQPEDFFAWLPNDPAACRRFLELLVSNRQRPISGSALQESFGVTSEVARPIIIMLLESLAGRSLGDRADVLYLEWRRALDVVYGNLDATSGELAEIVSRSYGARLDRPAGEDLFALHTYFALVARLFAVELLAVAADDRAFRPSTWSALSDQEMVDRLKWLDTGRLPGGIRINNLVESDVFGWWLAVCAGNVDLLGAVRTALTSLGDFAFPRAIHGPQRATDVLSDLYQSLVPRELRKKLGEFLTPHWLAEACLHRLEELGAEIATGRVLDPTCGTGTFLVPLLSDRLARLRYHSGAEPSQQEVQAVLDQVCGIDINPVAVVASRVNYALALGPLSRCGELTLPIWRADSLLVPDAPPTQGTIDDGPLMGRDYRQLQTSLPQPFPIPLLLATSDRMASLRSLLSEYVDASPEDAATRSFLSELEATFGPGGTTPVTADEEAWANDRTVAEVLYGRIRRLHDEDRDGIWAQIIANAYAPLFAGQFDVVVGNPPWLAWGKLPEGWREGSERLWRRYGLWNLPPEPGDTGGVLQVGDLATLVYAVALDRYARLGGFVGLLTPLAMLIADPGSRAFRRFRLQSDQTYDGDPVDLPFSVESADDWSQIQPFAPLASNKPVFIVSRSGGQQRFPVAAHRWHRVPGTRAGATEWRFRRLELSCEEGEFTPANPQARTSAWSFRAQGAPAMLQGGTNNWSFGTGLHTRGANGVYFLSVLSDRPSASGLIEIENLASTGRNESIRVHRGMVEAELVYPLLRGRDVSPWMGEPSAFVIVPHEPTRFDEVIPEADLARTGRFPATGAWIRQFRTVLAARATPPNRNWQMTGDDWCRLNGPLAHMRGVYLVVVREISGQPAAAVVERRWYGKLGRSEMPVIEHKLLFCSVPTIGEALYVTAFINSTPAQDFLASFANTTGITPRAIRTLPIPQFEPSSDAAAALVGAGTRIMAVHGNERLETISDVQPAVDSAVVDLGQLDAPSYRPQARRTRRPVARGEPAAEAVVLPGFE